ncbi:MAG: AI-2E family transporter [Clostridia bacterium]|nr:AI-2E family transporter [Clostridia bacterium]
MKRFGRYSTWVMAFVFLAALIAVYKIFDNLGNIRLFFHQLASVLKPFILGFVFSYLLSEPCRKLEKGVEKTKNVFLVKHKKQFSVALVYIVAVLLIAAALSFMLPAVSKNIVELWANIPYYFDSAVEYVKQLQEKGFLLNLNLDEMTLDNSIQKLLSSVDINSIGAYAQGVVGLTSGIINVFMGIIISIYMLLEKDSIKSVLKRVIYAFVPQKTADNFIEYSRKVNDIFSKFISCQLLDAVIVGTIASVLMSALRVKYALMLGAMIGLFNLIPYFGAIVASVLSMIITVFTGGIAKALWLGIFLIALQQVDGNIIGPKIMGSSLDISPLWIIFAVTVGGGFFGVLGLLVAVPVLAIVKIIFWDILEIKEENKRKIDK